MPTCEHDKGEFRCKELSLQDVRRIHQKFYQHPSRDWQTNFILQHVSVSTPKRSCTPAGISSRRNISTTFYLAKRRENVSENIKQHFI